MGWDCDRARLHSGAVRCAPARLPKLADNNGSASCCQGLRIARNAAWAIETPRVNLEPLAGSPSRLVVSDQLSKLARPRSTAVNLSQTVSNDPTRGLTLRCCAGPFERPEQGRCGALRGRIGRTLLV